ncbi:MAG: hypothetical protein H7645_08230 [Candidatus Heimdallarchaeota archaeon]|nr:hypothetical protein [Candidatus Heimdallarchaeota archaeon]MCK4770311.1 hypothetical protein [Candidatus Heimdallarchaeota archaeon]
MGIQRILPPIDKEEEIILLHRNGAIIAISETIYQVRIFREPERKIFTTSLENAYRFLRLGIDDFDENEGYYLQ